MKKSMLVLLSGAIAVPVISLVGLGLMAAPLAEATKNAARSFDEGNAWMHEDGGHEAHRYPHLIIENKVVSIDSRLELSFQAMRVKVGFDAALSNQARLSLFCSSPETSAVTQQISNARIALSQTPESGKGSHARCLAKIDLPAKLQELELNCQASACEARSSAPLDFDRLVLRSNVNKIEFESAAITLRSALRVENGAGKVELAIGDLRVPAESGEVKVSLQNAAGKIKAEIGGVAGYSVDAQSAAGKVEVRDGGREVVSLRSLASSASFSKGDARTKFDITSAAGKVELELDTAL